MYVLSWCNKKLSNWGVQLYKLIDTLIGVVTVIFFHAFCPGKVFPGQNAWNTTGISLPPGGDLQPLTLKFITASINLFPTWVCELLNFGTINIVN